MDPDSEHPVAPLALGLAVAAAAAPLFAGKYVFFLDSVVGPDWPALTTFYGFSTPTYGGRLPLTLVLHALAAGVGASVAQKALFATTLSLVAFVPYRTLPGSRAVRLYGGLLFLFNPFTYVRLLAGHWFVLWGLAMLPFALVRFDRYLREGGRRNLALAVAALTLLGFSSHLLFATGFLLAVLVCLRYAEGRRVDTLVRAAVVPLVAVPVNAYWLGPVAFSPSGPLAAVGSSGIATFAPNASVFNALYSVASMHGFWRAGYAYPADVLPGVELLFVPVLFLSVYGFLTHRDDPVRGPVVDALGVTWVVALLMGAGAAGPAAPAYRWLFEHAPLFAGLRDSQKLVALLVLVYAYLGGLGLATLRAEFARNGRTYARVALSVAVIVTPVVYTLPMATGYAGQINAGDYPAEWYDVRSHLQGPDELASADEGYVLFLPWHQYADYSWLENEPNRIPTPARTFFERPVIQGDNLETGGVYSRSSNPVSRYVQHVFGLGPHGGRANVTRMGRLLARLNVEYVVVTKEADWHRYDAVLRNQSDLELSLTNDRFRVYRNRRETTRAYATDEIVTVSGADAFVARSRHDEAVTGAVVLDDDGSVTRSASASRSVEPLSTRRRSPVEYRVEGTDRDYVVYRPSQTAASGRWRYGASDERWSSLGFAPVFEADDRARRLVYAPFYRTHLPSYALSLIAAAALTAGALRRPRQTSPAARRTDGDA